MSRQATFFDPKGVPLLLWGVPLLFLLAALLVLMIQTVVHFDPKFKVPYLLGGLILGDSGPHVPEALKILDQGRVNHPDAWRFPFYTGYVHYFSLGDPREGGKALESAAQNERR